jgi:hypothetical protein
MSRRSTLFLYFLLDEPTRLVLHFIHSKQVAPSRAGFFSLRGSVKPNKHNDSMKILPMDPTYRHWLISKAALAFDSQLNEHLIGLTHNESAFFVEMSKDPLAPLASRDVNELERYLSLYERHSLALALQHETDGFKARH